MVGLIILVVIQLILYCLILGVKYSDYKDYGSGRKNSTYYKSLVSFRDKWPIWHFCIPFYPLWTVLKMGVKSIYKGIKEVKEL
jgi:hypothetical protein